MYVCSNIILYNSLNKCWSWTNSKLFRIFLKRRFKTYVVSNKQWSHLTSFLKENLFLRIAFFQKLWHLTKYSLLRTDQIRRVYCFSCTATLFLFFSCKKSFFSLYHIICTRYLKFLNMFSLVPNSFSTKPNENF
jgi:hypothetical protein